MITEVAVIGDSHGCFDTLVSLIEKIKLQFPDAKIVLVGDMVDRGPKSRQIINYVLDNDIKTVRGNHEMMMATDILKTTEYPGTWEMNGGDQTLKSYKAHKAQLISHSIWMENLPVFLKFPDCKNENGDYLVVSHSTIQDYWKDGDIIPGSEDDIMWNREFVSETKGMHQGIFNVYGHSPTSQPQIGKFHANIDTGVCFKRADFGKLTALHFPSMTIIQQENID